MPTLRLLPHLEDAIRQLPGVRAVSVVTGPDASPTEIHVLASPGKPPKQVVRDVQSLAMAQHEIDIDHRIVSVVQIGDLVPDQVSDNGETLTPETIEDLRRPSVASVSVRTSGTDVEVQVHLRSGDDDFAGAAVAPVGGSHRPRVVAAATLSAARELLGMRCELESAQVLTVSGREVALIVLSVGMPRAGDLVLTGSAPVRGDSADAVARAVLDALNRQLTD